MPMTSSIVIEVRNNYEVSLSRPYIKVTLGAEVDLVCLVRLDFATLSQLVGGRIDDVAGKCNSHNSPQVAFVSPKLS